MDLSEQYDNIYRYCYMKTGHPETAEDLTQETFLKFLETTGYREQGRQLAYLYAIARNLCMDHFRRKQSLPLDGVPPSREADGRMPQIRPHAADMEAAGEDQLLSALTLKEAMARLEEELQEMIFLRYVNDLSAAQIGKILGISRFAVHRRLKRGLDQLRQCLRKEDFL
ncbi:MAG TPA: sigma-70 family RNA polymerase sigma factor [Candidatus Pullilachnospira intestinigallinarum]|nr:sigma-70 family RNA polymerase sigma factor [Candidatus Pullilachnospira intestinigallinarum]